MLKPLLVLFALLPFSLAIQQPAAPPSEAPIPDEAKRMVNPVKPTPESQAHAKKVYGYDCAMCHGENGNGKGDLVADLKLVVKDQTDPAALKDMTDGEIFYIIQKGKGDMTGEGDRQKPEGI